MKKTVLTIELSGNYKDTYYIIETEQLNNPEKYKGYVQNTMRGNGMVDYFENVTFEEYNEQRGGIYSVVTFEQLIPLDKYRNKSLCKPWEEINEERYNEMLNVLPPQKWHTIKGVMNIFFLLEAYTGSLHMAYVIYKGKYYEAMRNINSTDAELFEDFTSQIK